MLRFLFFMFLFSMFFVFTLIDAVKSAVKGESYATMGILAAFALTAMIWLVVTSLF